MPAHLMLNALTTLLVLIGTVPLDVMLPSFPEMTRHFGTNMAMLSWSLGIFSLVFALAQGIVGPLADRYGRKPVLHGGLWLALAGTGLCLIAPDFTGFMVGRVIQALGCASFVVAQAIVQDVFTGEAGLKARIRLATLGGLFIAVAPLLGTLLQQGFGWRGSLYCFCVMVLLALLVSRLGYADPAPRQQQGGWQHFARVYGDMFRNLHFTLYWIISALGFACHFAFIIASPQLFLAGMGLSESQYAWVLLLYGLAYLGGGMLASRLGSRISLLNMAWLGNALVLLAAVLMSLPTAYSGGAIAAILIPMVVCTLGTSLIRPATTTLAMNLYHGHAGTASSAGNTIRMAVGALLSLAVTSLGQTVALNLQILLLCSAVLCFVLLKWLGLRPVRTGLRAA